MGDEPMEGQDRTATLWLGYNVGYFCFRATFDRVDRLNEEFLFLINNLRRLGLDNSEIFGEAKTLAEKISTLGGEKLLDKETAEDLFERAFGWRDRLGKDLENKAAFWTGYNIIYLITQSRRAASHSISRELYFLMENMKSSGLPAATIMDEIKSIQSKIQALGKTLLDEKTARELEEACLRWRSELLRLQSST